MAHSRSRPPAFRRRLAFLLLAGLVAGPGCFGNKPTTIHGKVTYKGVPVSVGAIYFHGADDRMAMGNLGADGSFTATDVPLGEVRVSLQVRDPGAYAQQMAESARGPAGKSKGDAPRGVTSIPPKYADPNTSGLTYSIDSKTSAIDVQLE